MPDFAVTGADQFLRLSKALKEAGEFEVRKQLHKALRDTVNDIKPRAAQALSEGLPSGIAGRGNAVKQAVQVKTGTDPGVSVVVRYGKAGRGLGASNAKLANAHGRIRHPVWADGDKTRNQWPWVDQDTPGALGWFDRTYEEAAPELLAALERALQVVADDIVQKGR